MNKATFYPFVAAILALAGCATQSKSIGLGGAIGAGGGAVLGGIADPGKNGEYRTRNVIVGSALGGMAGMIAGSVIHENTEKQKQEAFKRGQSSPAHKPGEMPSLKNPKVDARWVEGRIIGNRYVEGHWEYVIVEPARWEEN
jgi:hypothetical protein